MADDLPYKAGTGAFDPHKTRLFHSAGSEAQTPSRPRKRPPPLPAARPDWHSKTRVLPIERLLPALSKPVHAARLDTAILKKQVRARPRLSKQRVYAWAVCLVLWVSVAAASGVPSQAPQSVQPDAITIRTSIPATARARPQEAPPRPTTPNVVAQPSAASERPTPPPAARVSPRAAIEALAAGDTLTASHLYAALAQQHPDNLAYVRASRTLAQRIQAEAKTRGATP